MDRWVDPDETDPATWRGRGPHDGLRTGEAVGSVEHRAARTPLPYQYEVERHHTDVGESFRRRAYTDARVVYNCGVDTERRVKLLTRGLLWGGGDEPQRFKAQYRRSPPPTETAPFEEYAVWTRYQFGRIERGDGRVRFVPGDEAPDERVERLPWSALYEPVRRRLVELELVRNPPFAVYRLRELGEWAAYRTALRYDPEAFAIGP